VGKIEILSPRDQAVFPIDGKELLARVTLEWKLPADFLAIAKNLRVEVQRLLPTNKREIVFQKALEAGAPRTTGKVALGANRPGDYEWRVFVPETELSATSHFRVDPEFEALILKDPLIGGRTATNNRYAGSLLKEFSIVVGWEPYAAIKPGGKYTLRFYDQPKAGRVIYTTDTADTKFEINRGKVLRGRVYYDVSTQTAAGLVAKSKRGEISFLFDPPLLALPANGTAVSLQDVQARGGTMLLTWQKTNFTERYELELATDPDFKSVALKHSSTENFFAVKASRPGTYYWRVRSFNQANPSEFSKPARFNVE
jgi:hypothetical protein